MPPIGRLAFPGVPPIHDSWDSKRKLIRYCFSREIWKILKDESRFPLGSGGRLAEYLLDARHVFGHIHADRIVLCLRHANLVTVFHPAQLLELLDALQVSHRQSW